jgi:hypothetical protein
MRASNLSLVIATGYCLLWAQVTVAQVTVAQETLAHGPSAQGPSNISISPPSVTPSGVYTVFWAASSDVVVDDVRLVGVGVVDDGFGSQTSTFTTTAQRTFHGHLAAKHTAVLLTVLKRPIPTTALLPQLLHHLHLRFLKRMNLTLSGLVNLLLHSSLLPPGRQYLQPVATLHRV